MGGGGGGFVEGFGVGAVLLTDCLGAEAVRVFGAVVVAAVGERKEIS